jgi:hypothetical protein
MSLNIEASDPTRHMHVVKIADAWLPLLQHSELGGGGWRSLTHLSLSWEDHSGLEAFESQETIFGIQKVRRGDVVLNLSSTRRGPIDDFS